MGFADGYTPREYNQVVPEGDYKVRLGLPQDVIKNGWSIREIPIQISGFPDHQPDKWSIFARPMNDAEKAENWDKQMTRNCDAFGIPRGEFRPQAWQGKVGKVHIAKDKNGYMQVRWAIADDAAHAAAPVTAHKPAPKAPEDPFGEPARTSPASSDGFTDDIPF